jgi:transposase
MAVGEENPSHDCEWREKAEALASENVELRSSVAKLTTTTNVLAHEVELLKRRVLGPSSEKLPPVLDDEVPAPRVDFEAVLQKRRERAKAKLKLDVIERRHPVPAADRRCPKCGNTDLTPLGEGKASTLYEYQPARLVAYRDVRETLRCKCGEGIVTAPGQPNWQEQSR